MFTFGVRGGQPHFVLFNITRREKDGILVEITRPLRKLDMERLDGCDLTFVGLSYDVSLDILAIYVHGVVGHRQHTLLCLYCPK